MALVSPCTPSSAALSSALATPRVPCRTRRRCPRCRLHYQYPRLRGAHLARQPPTATTPLERRPPFILQSRRGRSHLHLRHRPPGAPSSTLPRPVHSARSVQRVEGATTRPAPARQPSPSRHPSRKVEAKTTSRDTLLAPPRPEMQTTTTARRRRLEYHDGYLTLSLAAACRTHRVVDLHRLYRLQLHLARCRFSVPS